MRKNLMTVLGLACCAALLAGGCNHNKQMASGDESQCKSFKGTPTTPNKVCVVMFDDPVNPATEAVEYKGQKYGLCCEGCRGKWNAMTDAQKEAHIAKAMAASK